MENSVQFTSDIPLLLWASAPGHNNITVLYKKQSNVEVRCCRRLELSFIASKKSLIGARGRRDIEAHSTGGRNDARWASWVKSANQNHSVSPPAERNYSCTKSLRGGV